MTNEQSGEDSRRIAAPPSVVFALVSDVTQIGRWAEECEACQWLDGATAATVGARFEGRNRFREHRWTTVSVVDEVVQERDFAFHTVDQTGAPLTRWRFTFQPDGDGTIVTEGFERLALPDSGERAFEEEQFGGRVRRNIVNIAASLAALGALAENR